MSGLNLRKKPMLCREVFYCSFVLFLFSLRHIRVSLSGDEPK